MWTYAFRVYVCVTSNCFFFFPHKMSPYGRRGLATSGVSYSLQHMIFRITCNLQFTWLRTFQTVDRTKTSPEVTPRLRNECFQISKTHICDWSPAGQHCRTVIKLIQPNNPGIFFLFWGGVGEQGLSLCSHADFSTLGELQRHLPNAGTASMNHHAWLYAKSWKLNPRVPLQGWSPHLWQPPSHKHSPFGFCFFLMVMKRTQMGVCHRKRHRCQRWRTWWHS